MRTKKTKPQPGNVVSFTLAGKRQSGTISSVEQGIANIRGSEQAPRSKPEYHIPVAELDIVALNKAPRTIAVYLSTKELFAAWTAVCGHGSRYYKDHLYTHVLKAKLHAAIPRTELTLLEKKYSLTENHPE